MEILLFIYVAKPTIISQLWQQWNDKCRGILKPDIAAKCHFGSWPRVGRGSLCPRLAWNSPPPWKSHVDYCCRPLKKWRGICPTRGLLCEEPSTNRFINQALRIYILVLHFLIFIQDIFFLSVTLSIWSHLAGKFLQNPSLCVSEGHQNVSEHQYILRPNAVIQTCDAAFMIL